MNITSPSELVRQARLKAGKNQKEFAVLLGKDQSLVSRYERGRAMPPGEVIMRCMHILSAEMPQKAEVTLDELLTALRQRLAEPAHAKARGLLFDLLNALV